MLACTACNVCKVWPPRHSTTRRGLYEPKVDHPARLIRSRAMLLTSLAASSLPVD